MSQFDRSNEGWGSWLGLCFSSTFFTGFIPGRIHPRFEGKGGGLMGSLVALCFLWFVWDKPSWHTGDIFLTTAVVMLVGVLWAVRSGEAFMLSRRGPRIRHNGKFVVSDFNETNIDEVAGMLCAAAIIWHWRHQHGVWTLVVAFVLFRILDTKKPWPIWTFENTEDTTDPFHLAGGIMFDDIAAGIIAGLITLALMGFMWHIENNSFMM